MADRVRRVDYYYVTVPDMPAEGQRILAALKDGGVNLLAFLGFPLGDGRSQIDLIPEDPASLREPAGTLQDQRIYDAFGTMLDDKEFAPYRVKLGDQD